MKIKNLKISKNIIIFFSGLTFFNFCLYKGYTGVTKLKPFKENSYKIVMTHETEVSSDGITNKKYYTNNKIKNSHKEALIIRTPYEKQSSDKYIRKNYMVPIDFYSDSELFFVLENVEQQEKILSQNFIKESINNLEEGADLELLNENVLDCKPEENKYEIGYINFDQDNNDYKYVKSEKNDKINSIAYTSLALGGSACYSGVYVGVSKKIKKKTKNK